MDKTRKRERNKLIAGNNYYLSGGCTKVELISCIEDDKPLCKILTVSISSKFNVGELQYISRKILYTRNNRAKSDYTKKHYWRKEND